MTYKQKVQKEVYDKVESSAKKLGRDADYTVTSPGFEKIGTYTTEDAVKHCKDIDNYLNQ